MHVWKMHVCMQTHSCMSTNHSRPSTAFTPLQAHLEQYGITVTQVTVGDPTPEALLEKLLIDKKKLVGARIRAVQEQDTAQAEAKTAQVELMGIVLTAKKIDPNMLRRRLKCDLFW